MKWKKNQNYPESHKLDFRWIENKEERNEWIKEDYDLTEEEMRKLNQRGNKR